MHVIRDSFDFYATFADAGAGVYWDTATGTGLLSPLSRFGVGQALRAASVVQLTKASGRNETVGFAAFAFFNEVAFTGVATNATVVYFMDAATVQCSVTFMLNGSIIFRRGDETGTVLATFTSAYSAQLWTQCQIKVVISPTVGEVHIRLNGNTSDDFAATGLNTRASANTQVNAFALKNTGNANTAARYDDLWFWDGNAGGEPHDWIGDVRAVQIMPNADASPNQFAPNAATINYGNSVVSATRSIGANNITTLNTLTMAGGTLGTMILNFNAAVVGNFVALLYDSDGLGGLPQTLLAASNQVTNPIIGNNTFTFSSPPTVAGAGHVYYIALLGSAACVLRALTGATYTNGYSETRTYTTTPGNMTAPGATGAVALSSALAVITMGGHYAYVQDVIQDGTITTLADATVTDAELFTGPGLPFTPAAILGVSLRTFVAKSDAGARSGQPYVVSGATTQNGTSVALGTSFQNNVQVQDVDPATGVAWSASGVNNLKFGVKVSA